MHLPHLSSFTKTPVIFITTCIHQRRELLANRSAHAVLREVWTKSATLNGWYVGQYMVMPDHVHLFASPGAGACSLAAWMRLWKAIAAKQINHATNRTGALWQADYFDRYLRTLHDYEQKWTYVEWNPVRRGLVETPEQWLFRGVLHDLRSRLARD